MDLGYRQIEIYIKLICKISYLLNLKIWIFMKQGNKNNNKYIYIKFNYNNLYYII